MVTFSFPLSLDRYKIRLQLTRGIYCAAFKFHSSFFWLAGSDSQRSVCLLRFLLVDTDVQRSVSLQLLLLVDSDVRSSISLKRSYHLWIHMCSVRFPFFV